MSDMIDREQALACFEGWYDPRRDEYHDEYEIPGYEKLESLPYIEADIIFCGDCVHCRNRNGRTECALHDRVVVDDADFCSWAERREDGSD